MNTVKSALAAKIKTTVPAVAALIANPVVVRDLRAQMRGTKSYWYQGAYLLLLGILAICGYAQATGQGLWGYAAGNAGRISIVQAQSRLEGFYYFIFITLAALISLIAPALTAASIVGERQRQSLDLLVTTPLTASELLIGKLISSIAFLGLLLALSLPASALCVLLGGATLGDIFRIYLLLAVDGILLAGIGLFFSCATRTNLLSILWSYIAVAAFLALTFAAGGMSSGNMNSHTSVAPPLLFVGAINPFMAVLPSTGELVALGPIAVPAWTGALVVAALVLRLLLTASAYRLGLYGGKYASSLRRQLLPIVGLGSFLTVHGIYAQQITAGMQNPDTLESMAAGAALVVMVLFLITTPFLPALFVPAGPEDAPPGAVEASMAADKGWFRTSRAFLPLHAGSLPYFLLLILLSSAGVLAAYRAAVGSLPLAAVEAVACATLYIAALGFLTWAVARFAASLVRGVSQARGLTFGILALFAALPLLVLTFTSHNAPWNNDAMAITWLLYPLVQASNIKEVVTWTPIGACQAALWGLTFVLLRALRVYKMSRVGSPLPAVAD